MDGNGYDFKSMHCQSSYSLPRGERKHEQESGQYNDVFLDFSFFPLHDDTTELSEISDADLDLSDFFQGSESSSFEIDNDFSRSLDALILNTTDGCDSCTTSTQSEEHSQDSFESTSFQKRAVSRNKEEFKNEHKFSFAQEEKWNARYKELLEFVKEKGHALVPSTYPKNKQLSRWVRRQRNQNKLWLDGKPSSMTQDRINLLNSAGFVWDIHEATWREKLEALDEFVGMYGHSNVPTKHKDNNKLGSWVKCQRRQYKLYIEGKPSAMTPERISELEKRSFEWEARSILPKLASDRTMISNEEKSDLDEE